MARPGAVREAEDLMLDSDGAFDSRWSDGARTMLERVEQFMAEHPDLNGVGKIPVKRAEGDSRTTRMKA